jgi:hypothetical protein
LLLPKNLDERSDGPASLGKGARGKQPGLPEPMSVELSGSDHMVKSRQLLRPTEFLRPTKFLRPITIAAAILSAALALTGCGHKLVAHGGDTTVPVFTDKASFEKLKSLQSQGGLPGIIGGLGTSLAKKVDNGTPVKVISSDDDGYQIEVLDGASKGTNGYVSKDSVD